MKTLCPIKSFYLTFVLILLLFLVNTKISYAGKNVFTISYPIQQFSQQNNLYTQNDNPPEGSPESHSNTPRNEENSTPTVSTSTHTNSVNNPNNQTVDNTTDSQDKITTNKDQINTDNPNKTNGNIQKKQSKEDQLNNSDLNVGSSNDVDLDQPEKLNLQNYQTNGLEYYDYEPNDMDLSRELLNYEPESETIEESENIEQNNIKNKLKENFYWFCFFGVIALGLIIWGITMFYRRKNIINNIEEDGYDADKEKNEAIDHDGNSVLTDVKQDYIISDDKFKNHMKQEDIDKELITDENLDFQNDNWCIVGASVIGSGHQQNGLPCQDNNKIVSIDKGWGIAMISDGAGSAKHSDLGSKIIVECGCSYFKEIIDQKDYVNQGCLPTDDEWKEISFKVLKKIRDNIMALAKKKEMDINSLAATCLAVIYSPFGLLVTHVGDGRMGYQNLEGDWLPMMKPHKGEEANQTVFLVSDFWSIPNFSVSSISVPESRIVREPVRAFVLMSDGCENTAWKCMAKDPESDKYFDRNEPFEGFFKPVKETIEALYNDIVSYSEIKEKWERFLVSGTIGFKKEQDDKTMIFGVNLKLLDS